MPAVTPSTTTTATVSRVLSAPERVAEATRARVREAVVRLGYTPNLAAKTLRTLRSPTLVVCGDRDPLVPMDDVLAMYDHIPDCGLWLLPHATHVTATNTWRAESFATEILRFLQRR